MDDRSAMPEASGAQKRPDGEVGEGRDGPTAIAQQHSITNIIEHQVLPRLVLSHRRELVSPRVGGRTRSVLHPNTAHTLAELVIDHDLPTAEAFLRAEQQAGRSVESLYLDYLAPAARYLGDLWAEDRLTFTQVTSGTGRLQQLLYSLSDSFEQDAPVPVQGRRVLLAPVPGEQHSLGLSIVASYFRRGGWDVAGGARSDEAGLLDAVRCEWFDLVGLSLSCDRWLDRLAGTISKLRRQSKNRSVGILLGGPIIEDMPNLAREVGADASVLDVRNVTREASGVLSLMAEA